MLFWRGWFGLPALGDRAQFLSSAGNDRTRRVSWRQQAVGQCRVEAEQAGLCERRQIRQQDGGRRWLLVDRPQHVARTVRGVPRDDAALLSTQAAIGQAPARTTILSMQCYILARFDGLVDLRRQSIEFFPNLRLSAVGKPCRRPSRNSALEHQS